MFAFPKLQNYLRLFLNIFQDGSWPEYINLPPNPTDTHKQYTSLGCQNNTRVSVNKGTFREKVLTKPLSCQLSGHSSFLQKIHHLSSRNLGFHGNHISSMTFSPADSPGHHFFLLMGGIPTAAEGLQRWGQEVEAMIGEVLVNQWQKNLKDPPEVNWKIH